MFVYYVATCVCVHLYNILINFFFFCLEDYLIHSFRFVLKILLNCGFLVGFFSVDLRFVCAAFEVKISYWEHVTSFSAVVLLLFTFVFSLN